ncbi:hypothetical protein RhiirA5_351548 [Rhizophagus irregularis]|uniref:F-box domain-containing protein n=1 Tax=Rhizophagus irregularis TaxID=588596 RepID=A0A2N0Q375_9GLOM|nr:hypothetical protein RhiirA5_351548 [Rhizophagus irregularis]
MMEYEYYNSYNSKPSVMSTASRIPPEIFINICQYLPPIDLISLARVSKQFHGYLCSTDSFTTKEIWKNSRITFLPFVQMPPPEGMTELQYVKFISERGCQFCGKPRIRKIYWAFLVRCCKKCLEDRTIRLDQIRYHLFSQNSVPDDIDIVSGLTFITGSAGSGPEKIKHRPSNLYWIQDVHKAYNEFNELSLKDRQDWIIKKREEGRSKMEEVIKRELENENEYWSKTMENSRKRNDRVITIDNLIRKETNEFGFPRFKMSVVNKCLTYNKAMGSTSTSPFTKRAWIGFRNKLIPEYLQMSTLLRLQRQEIERNLAIDVAIQTRQMDIIKLIFELLRPEIDHLQSRQRQNSNQSMDDIDMERNSSSSSESNSDSDDSNYNLIKRMECNKIFESSLIKFLPWCPSFRNPPFMNQDPRILWDDEFLMNVLVPQLREEAQYLKDHPAPIETVRGAFLYGGLRNKRIFKCKLCHHYDNNLNPPKHYSFYEIRLHLAKSNHKVRMINDDLMIEVVPSQINTTCNAQIFPRNKPDLFFAAGFNCNLICNLLS